MTGRDAEGAQAGGLHPVIAGPDGELPRVIAGPDGDEWVLAGWDDQAQLAQLARMLADVDEILRTSPGYAALEEFYAARGSISPGYDACLLIDGISFTAPWLRRFSQRR
jgi:hypothetical protein